MIRYDFDRSIDRRDTCSLKYDTCLAEYGLADVIPMWVADMDFEVPPPVAEAVGKRAGHPIYGYPRIPDTYWTSIIGWLRERHGWDVRREWLSKSPGVVTALNLCVQAFTRPDEKVIIQTPVYYPFYSTIENNGRRIVRNPLRFEDGRWEMDFENLAAGIDDRTRLLILCSPHNPVGRVWTRDELARLGEICAARDLIVISDEIHGDLVFRGHRHIPTATVTPDLAERTVTCLGPSKTFNVAGLFTSVVLSRNSRLLGLFDKQAERCGLTMGSIFGIAALEAAYAHGADWLDQLLPYIEENMDFAERAFRTRVPRIRFLKPEGTYLALLDCRALGMAQEALDDFFLRKAGVLFDEGTLFGESLAGFERMNLACPRALVEKAIDRIERAVDSL
jgi:cysteine-S-conjugate beta-lyase